MDASGSQSIAPSDSRETCRLRRIIYRIDYEGCVPRRLLSFACQGQCHSYAQLSGTEGVRLERQCSCCQETRSVTRQVTIRCLDPDDPGAGPTRSMVMRVMLPTRCMCRPCSAGVGVEPMELAGMGDKRTLWGGLV
ncbi:hypothetical protein CAPTEDRAFT_113601 [Capitella teleta]|uniref:Bursicon n=1 Tax=Capitella teleta TaxID=283909 RepID=R7TQD0_CAPTE|nr:hypothetical protein CAPTEDRAFT_113601 [Capitella teleta]|eukprot:ELT93240.1 hypothetical protein CAPTEDRAFT_113601 [Capitella teleta]